MRRQNFVEFPRLVYVIDEDNYSDERIRDRLGVGGKALLKSANVVLIVNNELKSMDDEDLVSSDDQEENEEDNDDDDDENEE